jgi:hypothetical protein
MANGLAGLNPFPQFAPGGKGGLVPQLQMPASNVSAMFPRTSGGGGGRRELTLGQKIAPFAPYAVEGLASLFGKEEPIKTAEEFYASIRPPQTPSRPPTDQERARYDMYLQLGEEPQQEEGFDWKEFVPHLVGAAATGEGALDYGKTYAAMKTGERVAEREKESRRATGIAARLKTNKPVNMTFFNLTKYQNTGELDLRKGWGTSKGYDELGDYYMENEKRKKYISTNSEEALEDGAVWVPIQTLSELKDVPRGAREKQVTDLQTWRAEHALAEEALLSTYNVASDALQKLQKSATGETLGGPQVVATALNWTNDVFSNLDKFRAAKAGFLRKQGKGDDWFSLEETGGGSSGQVGMQGTGFLARDMFSLVQGAAMGDLVAEKELEKLTNRFEEETGFKFRSKLQEGSADSVVLRARMLQLAYMAAAANGQTGRTLSDKDLKFHLEMVGQGASQDPAVLISNVRDFVGLLTRGIDIAPSVRLSNRRLERELDTENPDVTDIAAYYYNFDKKASPMDRKYQFVPFLGVPDDPNTPEDESIRGRYGIEHPIVRRYIESLGGHKLVPGTTWSIGIVSPQGTGYIDEWLNS